MVRKGCSVGRDDGLAKAVLEREVEKSPGPRTPEFFILMDQSSGLKEKISANSASQR